MKKALLSSAFVALFQTVAFLVVLFGFSDSVSVSTLALAALAATLVATLVATLAFITDDFAATTAALVAATTAALVAVAAAALAAADFAAVASAATATTFVSAFVAALAAAFATVLAFVADFKQREEAREPWWAIALALLPFWIGPVFGGALYVLKFRPKVVHAVAA